MKSITYPLAVPPNFLKEMQQAAKETGLSTAATIRQSAKLGLPKLREQMGDGRVTNVTPWPARAARALYAQPDEEEDSIRRFMDAQSKCAKSPTLTNLPPLE
ncbi:MAG TPA: hypothetical protein VMU04_24340 [Candidatus Acidoferrum sp.]|nr:hypothetical protein [Candidatus Acidoferrum sp.]